MSKETSAELIMKLYDLRREEKMREARNWFVAFFPQSAEDVMNAMIAAETSASYRMAISYWDMAAGFVNHGAIDEEMFLDASSEPVIYFAKVAPYLAEVRERMQMPGYLKHLEALVGRMPDADAVLAGHRERMKRWMEARAAMSQAAG